MSLDFSLSAMQPTDVLVLNITHNLGQMAVACGVYKCLWRPKENGYEKAIQIIPDLEHGLRLLRENPQKFKSLNPENGWGSYELFVSSVEKILASCWEHPQAEINSYT